MLLAALLALLTPCFGAAQTAGSERGAFLVRNVSPLELGGHPLTLGSVQDARGVLYVASGDGVLTYDGAAWRTISLPAHARAEALARDDGGTVFVAAPGDLGYLAPDAAGLMRFVSLKDRLAELPAFADAAPLGADDVHAANGGVIFDTGMGLVRWTGMRFEPIGQSAGLLRGDAADAGEALGTSVVVDGRLLVDAADGVMEVRGDALVLLPGTEPLAGRFVGAAQLDARTLLLVEDRRIWRYADGTLTPFTDAEALGVPSWFSAFIALPAGGFVVGTVYDGLRFVDAEGRAGWRLGEAEGLRDDEVKHLDIGGDGRLYVSLLDGFAHVDPSPALTVFGKTLGADGQTTELARHDGILYAATSTGVYRLVPSDAPEGIARFADALGSEAYVFDLHAHDGRILAATGRGVFDLTSGRPQPVGVTTETGSDAAVTDALGSWPGGVAGGLPRLLLGVDAGVVSRRYDRRAGTWSAPDTLALLPKHHTEAFIGRGPRERWTTLFPGGLLRLTAAAPADTAAPRAKRFGPEDGLPPGRLFAFVLGDDLFVQSESGLSRYDEATERFAPDSTFGSAFAGGARRFVRPTVTGGALWSSITTGTTESIRHRRTRRAADGRYAEDTPAAMHLIPATIAWTFLDEAQAHRPVVWVATNDRVYRYDASRAREPILRAPVVRRVTLGDSALAHGEAASTTAPTLGPGHTTLRFTFALPQLDAPERTRYSTRLAGFDAGWSAWTDEAQRDYTNLPGRTYQFQVRARDVYGRVSEAKPYVFTVRPPWYLTAWALLAFAALGALGVVGLVRWRTATITERAEVLERTVEERTATISEQAEQLRALDVAKSRFFANISHELRTPLALITGPLAEIRARGRDLPEDVSGPLAIMQRNGQRLSGLIDQILKLTRIEAGALTLDLAPYDLAAFVRFQTELYEGLAQHRGVALVFEADAGPAASPIVAAFEPDSVAKILSNLIGNALKFTPHGGMVTVRVRANGSEAVVEVEDTGVGIASEALPHVFDRFYQADDSATRIYEGTGIGLALARELALLHGGTLAARSTPGAGSTFTFALPLSRSEPIAEPDWQAASQAALPDIDAAGIDDAGITTEPSETGALTDSDEDADRTTVLVVEDNADLRAFVRGLLQTDFRILTAADGAEGLRLATQALPDLIVTDVMMPVLDGFTMAKALRDAAETAAIPVIALTARAGLEDRVEGLETGVDAYLTKPFDAEVLRLQVRNLIARQHRLRDLLRSRALPPPNTTARESEDQTAAETSADSRFVRDVRAQLEVNLSDPDFNVEALAEALALSRQQLHRRLVAEVDTTPVAFLRSYRLKRAADLLRAKEGTIAEIGYAVGFNSQSYFGKSFRKHFGVSPTAFLEQNERASAS